MLRCKFFAGTAVIVALCTTFDPAHAQFQPGEFITNSPDSWGATPSPGNAAQLLLDRFDIVYGGGAIEVGFIGSGFSMVFTNAVDVVDYLPASGGNGPLNSDLIDPTSTSSGAFGGHVLALQLDVDFNDAGDITGSSSIPFGELVIANLTQYPIFNELTVREYLTEANIFLGGGPVPYPFDDIAAFTDDLTRAFEGGAPSEFAQNHLRYAGDLDGDGDVDGGDFLIWQRGGSPNPLSASDLAHWRTNSGQGR